MLGDFLDEPGHRGTRVHLPLQSSGKFTPQPTSAPRVVLVARPKGKCLGAAQLVPLSTNGNTTSSDLKASSITTHVARRVRDAFLRAFDLPPDFDLSGLAYQGTARWDSIGHMQLVAELEDEFGIMLEPEDIVEIGGYTEALGVLRKYGVDPSS